MKNLKAAIQWLSKPYILFFSLAWLMVLLISGTVAQKYIGLFEAQSIYFMSFIFWLGPIPTPGGFTTMIAISLNLVTKLIVDSPWRKDRIGTLIAHLGALLLLLGGLLTVLNGSEGNMQIEEGKTLNYVSDYHHRELAVYTGDSASEDTLLSLDWDELRVGKKYAVPGTDLSIEVLKMCRNCDVFERKNIENSPYKDELRGRAQAFDFEPIPLEKEHEANRYGTLLRVTGSHSDQDGAYMSFDFIQAVPGIVIGDKRYDIAVRKKRTYLPFSIKLIDFVKEVYPGTDKPKSFHSEIIVQEPDTEWRSLIEMNKPLRYGGFTFYQSSYIQDGPREATVLAVVKNAGRMFPYISSIVMCIGLLFHLFLQLPKLVKRKQI